MKVTGILLREAIKRWELRASTASSQFSECLYAFEGDDTPNPTELAAEYDKAQDAVAKIQAAQSRYNLYVKLKMSESEEITLCQAVKRIGGAGRLEKMWRSAAQDKGHDRYSMRNNERSKDTEYARRQVSIKDCVRNATEAAKYAAKLRSMIAIGNTAEVDIEDLDPTLFE